MLVSAKYVRYERDGSVSQDTTTKIEIEEGDKVRFVDNSFINDCAINGKEMRFLAGSGYGDKAIGGIVARIGSVQDAEWYIQGLAHVYLEMPIVILTDNNEIVYCNPLNIVRA